MNAFSSSIPGGDRRDRNRHSPLSRAARGRYGRRAPGLSLSQPSKCRVRRPAQRHHLARSARSRAPGAMRHYYITAPHLFKTYLIEQLSLLADNYKAAIYVGKSRDPIPLTFAVERAASQMNAEQRLRVAERFPMPRLDTAHDTIADGAMWTRAGSRRHCLLVLCRADRFLAASPAPLHRHQRTGTVPGNFVLHSPIISAISTSSHSTAPRRSRNAARRASWSRGGRTDGALAVSRPIAPPLPNCPQMPAYHLVQPNGDGITLVNIGVGPSNAKTITDHLAVLRPHVWLMIGHCGGLRASQRLGDYVLAHGYLRDDQVLDEMLPTAIPVPALWPWRCSWRWPRRCRKSPAPRIGQVLKGSAYAPAPWSPLPTATGSRCASQQLSMRFNQSRAIAIDMESFRDHRRQRIIASGCRTGRCCAFPTGPLHGRDQAAPRHGGCRSMRSG